MQIYLFYFIILYIYVLSSKICSHVGMFYTSIDGHVKCNMLFNGPMPYILCKSNFQNMYLWDTLIYAVGVARKRVKNTIKVIYIWVGNCIERKKKYQLNNIHTILSRYHQHHTCTGFVITIILYYTAAVHMQHDWINVGCIMLTQNIIIYFYFLISRI